MTRTLLVLRPEPGNGETVARLAEAGLTAVALPLFAVAPVAWTPPAPDSFDALLLTSANPVRHGGAGLDALKGLPVVAVGGATAGAARAAGFAVEITGMQDAATAVEQAHAAGFTRLLRLGGRDRTPLPGVDDIIVYASEEVAIACGALGSADGAVALLHSPRAARIFASLIDRDSVPRKQVRVAALSRQIADAAGNGWADLAVAATPDDTALVAAARRLAIDPPPGAGDKRAMSDTAPFDSVRPRSRLGMIAVAVVLAFIIGLALMWAASRGSLGGSQKSPATTAASSTETQPVIAPQPAPTAVAAAASDPVMLATRESALAAQIASLEARAATITADAAAASGNAGRAEAILVAFAARRALDRGVGLGYLEEQLRERFGATQPTATLAIIQASRDPVTIEALRQALDRNAAELASGGSGWWEGLGRELSSLVVLHEAGAPSPLPGDRLARARRMLDAGQVEPALAEIERLPGAARATQWGMAARRYIAARKALDTLEGAAILGSVAPASPAQPQALN